MNFFQEIINTYPIDLSIKPTTFDLWHVCLACTVVLLLFALCILLLTLLSVRKRSRTLAVALANQEKTPSQPEIKVVEKIVEVEKLVQAPAPEPIILKEASHDAALQVLNLLQQEARFIDFIKEDITQHQDADIGAAVRVVHKGCNQVINEHFTLAPVRNEQEGSRISLPAGFNATENRLTGNIVGSPPFTGTLVHKGWKVTEIRLPKLTQGHNSNIIAAAEIEL